MNLRKISNFVCLLSISTIPYFFHLQSANPFEGSKGILLRLLAMTIVAIEVLSALVEGRPLVEALRSFSRRFENSSARVILLGVAFFFASMVLSTALSIEPSLSFWGSYGRRQGLFTSLAYLVVFAFVALRADRAFVRRAITVLLQTGGAVCLYAFIQAMGRDPIGWATDVVSRPTSTLGNSGLVAAFVASLCPLAVLRMSERRSAPARLPRALLVMGAHALLLAALHLSAHIDGPASPILLLSAIAVVTQAWAFGAMPSSDEREVPVARSASGRWPLGPALILAMYVVTLLLTQSRGAQVAVALTGIVAWAFVWIRQRDSSFPNRPRSARAWIAGTACLGVVAALLVTWNLSRHPLADELRSIRYFGRMGQWLAFHEDSARERILLWFGDEHGSGVLGLVTAHLRTFLVGTGPETFDHVYGPFFPPSLTRGSLHDAFPDRAHQAELDVWATQGIVGLASFLFLYSALFWVVFRRRRSPAIYACTAAIVVLFIDDGVEIPSVASMLTFWTLLGGIVALVRAEEHTERRASSTASTEASSTEARPRPPLHLRGATFPWGAVLLAAILFGTAAWFGNLSEVRADMQMAEGEKRAITDDDSLVRQCEYRDVALSLAFRKSHYASELASTLVRMSARANGTKALPETKERRSTCRALFARGRVELLRSAQSLLGLARNQDTANKDILAHTAQVTALLYEATGEPSLLREATGSYEQAIAAAPNDVRLLNEHASLLARAGRTTEARAELERSSALDPEYLDTRTRMRNLLELERDPHTEVRTR